MVSLVKPMFNGRSFHVTNCKGSVNYILRTMHRQANPAARTGCTEPTFLLESKGLSIHLANVYGAPIKLCVSG